MLHWFQKSIISDESANWIHECAEWIITHFNEEAFHQHTPLVTPDKQYFPKSVTNQQEMAQYVLQRVVELAGIQQLPWVLTPANQCSINPPPLLQIAPSERHKNDLLPSVLPADAAIQVPFVAEQVKKPQDLVASTAHNCAQHLLWQSQLTPPGGTAYFVQSAEVLAVFFGFGVILANSAYTFRGSCAKCYDPRANRQASLSEAETLYALALFCDLKNIPNSKVLPHLKKYLKNDFKVAKKQIANRRS